MFVSDEFLLIKMPVESVEISRVNVDGDNINLTAGDVESFDVAGGGVEAREKSYKSEAKKKERKTLET
jgi:predicted ThiF/HesA family dinucleotide-utilizing enzyme